MAPELGPKSFGTFEKQAPGPVFFLKDRKDGVSLLLSIICLGFDFCVHYHTWKESPPREFPLTFPVFSSDI